MSGQALACRVSLSSDIGKGDRGRRRNEVATVK